MLNAILKGFLLATLLCSYPLYGKERAHLALIFDGKIEQNDPFSLQIEEELVDLLGEEFELALTPFLGDWTLEGAVKNIDKALLAKEIDLIITTGILSSYAMLQEKELSKPVVIGYNLSIFSSPNTAFPIQDSPKVALYQSPLTLTEEVITFAEMTKVKKIAFIGDASLIGDESFPLIREKIEQKMASIEVVPIFIPALDREDPILNALDKKKVEGVVFLPLWRMSAETFKGVIEGVNSRYLPSFSILGEREVEKGVLMTLTPKGELRRAARRVALDTQELLLSGNNQEIVFNFFRSKELIINEKTAHEIDLDLPWKVLREAILIDRIQVDPEEMMPLIQAVDLAIQNNLDLLTEYYIVKSGRQDVLRTFSRLMPQLNSRLIGRFVDQNSAKAGFGQISEKKVRSLLVASQMLYDERAIANFVIEKRLQSARRFNREAFELDIILDTSISYLTILRANAQYQIAIENVALSKANLKRAHELVDSGQARLSEVYRWESELALNRDALVATEVIIENLKTEFNRLLNRPLSLKVDLQDINPFDQTIFLDYGHLIPYLNTPVKFRHFKTLMTALAQDNSPSVKELTQEVMAEERNLLATTRAFYLPKFSAFGLFGNNLYNGGAGDTPPPGISNSKLESVIGVQVSYPFFTGGRRSSEKKKAFFEIKRLKTERASLIERIDERVIQAIDNMKARYEEIFLAQKAAEASEKNLVIVTNSYTRGVVSIVDLLDAQNQMIVSKQNYVDSLYDYLIAYMEFQRGISQYDFQMSKEEKASFKTYLIDHLSKGA